MDKLTTVLWFDKGQAREAAEFYAATFPDSHVGSGVDAPADNPSTPAGEEITVAFTVLGRAFSGLNGGPHFKPNEAVSFMVVTEDQAETDRYWKAIVEGGGAPSECGWCKDRWGFAWQITPRTLLDAMSAGGDEGRRAFEAMMTMGKIDVAAIDAARKGRRTAMRKVIGSAFVSLDGVMQAPGGPTEDPTGGFAHGGWLAPHFDEEAGHAIGAFFDRPYDLLLGRRTYDIFAAFWPYQTGDEAPMGEAFTAAGKYVLTRGQQPLPWENSHRLAGIDDLARLKETDGPDLLIQGSGTIYPALIAAGLLDRLTLMIFPVLLGAGKRLFGDGTPARVLRTVEHTVTAAGTVIATYEPAGPVTTAAIAPPSTSEREQERQRRMADGSW